MSKGLRHDFLVVRLEDYDYSDYVQMLHNENEISLPDNIVRYINDFIRWVPTYDSGNNMKPMKGLNYHGTTVIKSEGAIIMKQVFTALLNLFGLGPPIYVITGEYGWIDSVESPDKGLYSKIVVKRDELVNKLQDIVTICDVVLAGHDNYFIHHAGLFAWKSFTSLDDPS